MRSGAILLFAVYLAVGDCQLYDNLFSHLMSQNAKDTIPIKDADQSLEVSFTLVINDIINLDVKSGDAEMVVWYNTQWTDGRLAWDPKEYKGIKRINLAYDSVWSPDVVPYNARSKMEFYEKVVSSDGKIVQVPTGVLSTRCDVSEYLRKDKVTCTLKFGSWTYNGQLINLISSMEKADDSDFSGGRWELKENSMKREVKKYDCCPEEYIHFEYTLVFTDSKRNWF